MVMNSPRTSMSSSLLDELDAELDAELDQELGEDPSAQNARTATDDGAPFQLCNTDTAAGPARQSAQAGQLRTEAAREAGSDNAATSDGCRHEVVVYGLCGMCAPCFFVMLP